MSFGLRQTILVWTVQPDNGDSSIELAIHVGSGGSTLRNPQHRLYCCWRRGGLKFNFELNHGGMNMAWPFSKNTNQNQDADAALTEERLKIMANIAIEQVPLPEEGELNAEDAWTISPGLTMARLNSIGSVPTVAASLSTVAAAPTQVNTTVDTSGLERLISNRLDMVEDVLRMVEVRLSESPSGSHGETLMQTVMVILPLWLAIRSSPLLAKPLASLEPSE